eukprot:XP_011602619.1 PREDICTED: 5-hydroxytryptamine receptor 3A-like [Takifugu rubripes]
MVALRVLALLALIAAICNGETADCSYVALMKHLNLTSSSELPVMRPVKHWTTPTIVLIDMLLDGILEVDEKFQTVMSHISVYMKWKNEFLAWNSSVFCGMELLPVSLSLLWITILRKPLLYVVNFIVPLFYLLILDLASFFISEARGEKLGFKITILLSISVLLLILKDILPSTEDNLPMIGESSGQVRLHRS